MGFFPVGDQCLNITNNPKITAFSKQPDLKFYQFQPNQSGVPDVKNVILMNTQEIQYTNILFFFLALALQTLLYIYEFI